MSLARRANQVETIGVNTSEAKESRVKPERGRNSIGSVRGEVDASRASKDVGLCEANGV